MSKFKSSKSTKDMMQSKQAPTSSAGQLLASVNNGLLEMKPRLEAVLPDGITADRFMTTAYYHVRANPHLWNVEKQSLFLSFLQAAQQGLDFAVPNEAHIVPFKGKATLIRGYKGDLKNARRNPDITYIDAKAIYEADVYDVELGDTPRVTHKPPKFGKDRGPQIGFYAVAKDRNGNVYHEEMTNEQVHNHAKQYTKAAEKGPFSEIIKKGPEGKNWEAYGLKTVIHRICTRKLDLNTYFGQSLMREYAQDDKPTAPMQIDDAAFRPSDPVFEAEIDEGFDPTQEQTLPKVEITDEDEQKLTKQQGML